MPMNANPVTNLIHVLYAGKILENEWFLEVSCNDFDEYKRLPKALKYDTKFYGLTGWNSDYGKAFYKTSAMRNMAIAI